MIDYLELAKEHYAERNDRFITDVPRPIQLEDDDYIRVTYDVEAMKWIPSRPSRITYPTARKLINEYRKEYSERWRE